jgi:hypothetical protein
LQLPPSTSHLQIGFTALTLSDPMRVRFRYRLDGYDRDWVDAGAGRQATYTNLPPRQYQFRVAASAGDGTWGEPSAPLTFGIEPMFYQTRWFYFLCGLTVFLLVYASWRLHVRQVRRQFALVLAERIRMSRAIHDTLLQGLAALALQVDDLSHSPDLSSPAGKKRILAVRRQVEGYIRQARRSILDLRTPTLATRDLPQAIREAAERAIGGRPVELDVTVTGTPHTCAAAIEEQLLLIGQEAVNNAVLHGQASRVAVELDYGEDQMSAARGRRWVRIRSGSGDADARSLWSCEHARAGRAGARHDHDRVHTWERHRNRNCSSSVVSASAGPNVVSGFSRTGSVRS